MAKGPAEQQVRDVEKGTPATEGLAEHALLHFDRNNPRSGDRTFGIEDDVLTFLIQSADVDELVTSMQSAGWVDFEPMIVERKSNIVLKGIDGWQPCGF
jgi:hypothetical protein